jgi:predicted nucleic acid-binding protein
MLVVADTSPFIALLKIGELGILPRLYGSVVIPPEVAVELASSKRISQVRDFIAHPPDWLLTQAPTKIEAIEGLDDGECAAINLARELNADLLLIDETRGREAAVAWRIPNVRTAAVLFEAANKGILTDLGLAFEKLKGTNFRVPPEALDELLARHRAMKSK